MKRRIKRQLSQGQPFDEEIVDMVKENKLKVGITDLKKFVK